MALSQRKQLSEDQKELIRELYGRSQENPYQFPKEKLDAINELYKRVDAPDVFRTALDSARTDREALEYVQKYKYDTPTQELYKKIAPEQDAPIETPKKKVKSFLGGPSPEAMNTPSSMNITDVNSVLETEKKKQIIQQAIEEKNTPENIASEFEQIYKINPFENPEEAFSRWFETNQADPTKIAEYFENGTLDLENINESFTEALNSGKLDKEFGVIRPGDELKEEPKFDKSLFQPEVVQPESTTIKTEEPPVVGEDIPERDIWQAASELKLSEIVPFYTSSQEAIRLARALKLIGQLKSGNPISNDDKTFLKELADDRKFEKSTIAAQAFDTLKEMIPFAGEIFATYGIFGIAKKGTQKLLSRKIKSEIKDYVEKGLLIDTSSKIVKGSVFVTEAALLNKGFLTLSKMDDKISLEKQLPQFEFANEGLLITEQGMDKHTADKQATYDASREFLTEIVGGRFLQKLFPALKKGFNKITSKLTPGQSEVVVAQATTNTIGDAIQRVTGVKLSKQDLIKARQLLQSFGYDGVLEEWGEERIGDATNEIVYALANAKDENGESLLPGFDNEEYADNVVRDLGKGDFGKAWERTAVEFLAFSVPAGGAVTYAGTKSYLQEKTIKQKLPFLSKQISEAEEKLIEIEPQIKKLKEIEKPNPDDVIKLSDLLREKQKINTLQQLKQIIIDSPEIADEVDLSRIDLDKEITLTQKELEEQGVTLKGEGQKEDQEKSKVLGLTAITNAKLQLGLNEGASYDTVLEEYYGLIRRGGLSKEQKATYDEHYEKYKTDESYRVQVNEFINRMHEKMGLKPAVADVKQALSSDKLFDKEGKSYEYKSLKEPKKDLADKVFDYVGKLFNKAFGRFDKNDEMKEVYEKVQKRKLKISSKRAVELEKPEQPKAIPEVEQEFKPEEIEVETTPPSPAIPKDIKLRKSEAKKVKPKKKIFNFIKNRTKKVQVKELEKLSPVAIREVEAKLSKAPEVDIPMDQREPLEVLRSVLGDEQFTELTGLPAGPIKNLEKLSPKIMQQLQEKFPEYISSLEKMDVIDLMSDKEKEDILKKVEKKTSKQVIDLIKLEKIEPKKLPKGVSYQLAPASLSNQKYGAIKGFVKELAKEGEPARFWYEQSGKALLDITGGNKQDAKKLLSIIAITSPQMDVLTNFGQMIKGYYKAIKGEAPLAGRFPKAMAERIEKVMAGEEFGGLKTDKFYRNLMTVVEGGVPDVTVDMWMMRAFGIDKDSPTDLEYRRIEKHVQNIAEDLNWEPHQVQAAIWVSTKARWESIYSKELKIEKNLGRYKGSGKWSSEKVYKNFRKKMFTKLKKVELKDKSLIKAGFNYKDAIDKYKGRISLEVIPHPSTGSIPGVHDASYEEKLEYHKAITDILIDENGQDIIAKTLKIPTITKHNAPGFYEGESNPSHHTEVLFSQQLKHLKAGELDKVINEETINNIELYSAVEGLVTKQQAVGYTKEFESPSKKLANAVGVESDTPITEEQLQKVYDEMLKLGIDTGPMPTDYGFIMVNFMDNNGVPFSGVDNNTFYDNVENVLDKVFGDVKLETGRFTSLGGLLENDWRKDKNGENYTKRINQSNRQDAIKQLVDTLNGEIAQVNKAFEEKYGWDKPKKSKQKTKPQVSYQLEPKLYSPALRAIENMPQKSLKRRGLINYLTNKQATPAELDWLGIDEWAKENYKRNESIPKEDIIEFIKQNESEVIDVTLDTSTEDVASMIEQGLMTEEDAKITPMEHKFEKFTMVGGENYKELLVRHPDGTYVKPSHWDIEGIIVSLRLTTRFDTEGSKVLFIEEIQSDWTSDAHKLRQKEVNKLINKGMSKKEAEKKVPKDFGYKEVGDTPYKDGWIKLGVKKAILHAVNNNFDKIAVPTHEQIADMFDVSKTISEIRYFPIDPNAKRSDAGFGRFQVSILNNNRAEISGIPRYNTPEQLENIVGKGIVDRMMAGEGNLDSMVPGQMVLSGLDLRTPAKFHRDIYNALANTLAKQGRSLGGRPGTTDIDLGFTKAEYDFEKERDFEGLSYAREGSVPPDLKGNQGQTIKRKSLTLTDNLKDKVRKTGIPSFQLEPADQPLELSDETWRELFIRKIVNRLNRLENVTSQIGDVDEQTNAYLAAVLYEGKAEDRIDKFQKYIERYIKRLTKAGFTVDDIGEYLYARHAVERNKKVHEENPDFEGTGSGMTNKEANEILKRFKGTGIYKFAREFDKKVIKERLGILLDGGLITQETYDLFTKESPYRNYVPLKGTSEKKGKGTGTSGFSIVGKDIRRKRGRNSRADNPFVQALIDYEMAIIRAEKNAVTTKFYLFALENPTNLWEVSGRKHIPRYDSDGEVAFFDPMTLQENQVQAFVDGKLKVITIKDEALLNAMKKLGSGTTFKFAQQFNTYLRAIYTTFNPEFLITNFERDIQTALINIQADADIKVTAKIMKDIMGGAPMRAIYRSRREKGDAKLSVNKDKLNEYRKYYAEYKKEGGAVGWVASQSVEEKLNELKKVMARAQSSRNPKQFFRYLGKWVEDMNMTVEQAVRLATYANLRESGLSKSESAKISKELTVNFNQKGEWGSFINSLYLFSNATIQGNYFWMRAFARSKKVKAATLGIVSATVLLNIINRMNGGDDWEKYSDWEKDFHWLYILPNGNVVKFKVPYGYNIFHVMGNVTEEMIAGKTTPGKAMSRLFSSVVHAVSPIGAGEGLSQYVPTAFGLKQAAEIWANENFMGGRIYPDQPHYQPKKPDSQLYFDSVNPDIKAMTTWLNKVSGGSEKVSGAIDISPETVEHLLTAFTGGAGKFIERSHRTGKQLLAGETPPLKEIPFVRTVVSEPSKYTALYKMYDMLGESARTIYTEKEIQDFDRHLKMAREDAVITNKKAKKFKKEFNKNQREAKRSLK